MQIFMRWNAASHMHKQWRTSLNFRLHVTRDALTDGKAERFIGFMTNEQL